MLNNNRETLFRELITGFYEILLLNEMESKLDPDSCGAGFQLLADHILALIQSMEEGDSAPREILEKIKTIVDDGAYQVIN